MNKPLNKILTLLLILIALALVSILKPILPKITSVAPTTPSPTTVIKEAGLNINLNGNQTPTLHHLSPDDESTNNQLDPSQVTPIVIGTVDANNTQKPLPPQILAEFDFKPGGPKDMAINSKTGYIYVVNGSNAIGILHGTEQVDFFVLGMRRPSSLAVDEQNNRVYVVNSYSHNVTIIQGTQVLTTIAIDGQQPRDVTVNPKTGWAYVVSPYENTPPGEKQIVAGKVTVISGTQIIQVIPLGQVFANHILYDPINDYIYIGEGAGAGTVIVLDGLTEIARFEVDSGIRAMDINLSTGDVYVLCYGTTFNFAHLKNGALIDTLDLRKKSRSYPNLKVHPHTGDVYAITSGGRHVVVVRDMTIIARVPVGEEAYKMTIDPLSGNVYVANYADGTVTVINGTEVLTTIEVGWHPYGIGVNPINGWVYVSNTNDNTITILGYPE